MLIKLNTVSFVTSGHGTTKKVERTILEPVWVNPNHIAKITLEQGPADCPDITEITWGAGRLGGHIHVLETPEQITNLMAGYSKGGFA